ncbi:MAG TPA: M1 family aminopeptidase [Bryobacteraceae bacterium]|nr:M1 family aminopeptidase [Bryobacteraceae bacterium]
MRCLLPVFFILGIASAVGSPAGDLSRDIQQLALDPGECFRVIELNFNKEDIKVYLTSGYVIFAKPIHGVRTGAVFVANVEAGDAEVLLLPPVRSERLSLANFTDSPNLDEHFKAAVMVFSDGTAEELLERIQSTAKKSPEMGALIADQWTAVLRNLSGSFETRLVYDLLAGSHNPGFFYLAVTGDRLGNFDLLYDPSHHEQIFAGKLTYRDNRTYFDDWTSFPSRSVRNGAPVVRPDFALSNFRIDSTIDADLKLKVVTRVTVTPKRKLGATLPFFISRNMRVTEASIDGRPVEVFARESLRSNLIVSGDNQQFLLIPDGDLDRAIAHEVEIHQEGEVILKAGEGVYYVTSRGNWYPRLGMEFANYDLTFRYPKALTLVATGNVAEDRTVEDTRITRWKTESPIRFAGFNLGDFQSVSIAQDGYKIDVYANRHLEAALQQKGSPPLPPPLPGNPLSRSRRLPDLSAADPTPPPPDPAARLHLVAKDVAGALEFMTAQFGPPAMKNLSITPIPGRFGQGFPGLVYISTMAYLNPEQRPTALRERSQQVFFSELLDVHEVAHQWWGNLVLPASYQDEWLMEALANYSALLLLERKKGAKAAEAVLDDYRNHLVAKQPSGHTLESAGPITWGYRLQSSLAPAAWRAVTYEKGTWIIHMLRRRLGDEKFFSLLHEVCARYRLSTISTEQFRELAAQYTAPKSADANLKAFFENWIYGTGVPAVKLTYAWRGARLTGNIVQRDVEDDFSALIPVEVQSRAGKKTYWLATGSEPVSFSIPMKVAPAKFGLVFNDCLMTAAK